MTKGIWKRQGDVAVPVESESLATLRSYDEGAEFIADVHGARNLQQLKLFWKLVELVTDTSDRPKEVVKKDIAIALGFVTYYVDRSGATHILPDSISCEKMTQAMFRDFFNNAINVIAGWLNSTPADVRERFEDMIADKRYDGMRR